MLPKFHSDDQALMLLQSNWASIIDPFLKNPMFKGNSIKGVVLVNGSNVINHALGRIQQGWFITDQNAAAEIYRSADFNDKTLTLHSSAGVTINVYVF